MTRPMSMSRAVAGWIVLSGRTGHAADGTLGDIEAQTRRCLRALADELLGHGVGLDSVVKITIYLTDVADYDRVNAVYADEVPEPFPARTCVTVLALPGGASIEIEAWAWVGTEQT